MRPRPLAALVVVAACGPVVYPEQAARWYGTKKKTLTAVEDAVREAMAARGVKRVDAPGNEEPVLIDPGRPGTPGCVTGAWFTLDGKPKDLLGDGFQYAWHVCAVDGKTTVKLNCLEIRRSETTTDQRECDRVAGEAARRTNRLRARIGAPE